MSDAGAVAFRPVTIDQVVSETSAVREIASEKILGIQAIASKVQMLALNAMIEAARVGEAGRGFSVVANEVQQVGERAEAIAKSLDAELASRVAGLQRLVESLSRAAQDERLMDLALNAVELIDRNLYERTCDVRWWATDSDIVACATEPSRRHVSTVTERLGVILSAYTVYLDLWLCDGDGTVLANGRPEAYPDVVGSSVAHHGWFQRARTLPDGDSYVAGDIEQQPRLGQRHVATYGATVRAGGKTHGDILGVLAVHFDWEPQARAIVEGVRVSPADKDRTRVLLVDANKRVIAASDGVGLLTTTRAFESGKATCGVSRDPETGELVAFHRTPGYETYEGLGWWGVIVQGAAGTRAEPRARARLP